MIKGVNFTKELKTEELNDMSCGRNLNSFESNLVEKLKIIYRGIYKMEEVSFQEYTKAQDKLFWYERFMEINDNSDECYFDLNIDWKERYELLSNK